MAPLHNIEYFRWITINAFVEGFWPPILLILLVVAGLNHLPDVRRRSIQHPRDPAIGFLITYTVLLWKRGEAKTDLQRALVRFILVAAFGGP